MIAPAAKGASVLVWTLSGTCQQATVLRAGRSNSLVSIGATTSREPNWTIHTEPCASCGKEQP